MPGLLVGCGLLIIPDRPIDHRPLRTADTQVVYTLYDSRTPPSWWQAPDAWILRGLSAYSLLYYYWSSWHLISWHSGHQERSRSSWRAVHLWVKGWNYIICHCHSQKEKKQQKNHKNMHIRTETISGLFDKLVDRQSRTNRFECHILILSVTWFQTSKSNIPLHFTTVKCILHCKVLVSYCVSWMCLSFIQCDQ